MPLLPTPHWASHHGHPFDRQLRVQPEHVRDCKPLAGLDESLARIAVPSTPDRGCGSILSSDSLLDLLQRSPIEMAHEVVPWLVSICESPFFQPAARPPEAGAHPAAEKGGGETLSRPAPWGTRWTCAPEFCKSRATSRLQATTQAALRARAERTSGATLRASLAWTLNPKGMPNCKETRSATSAGACAKYP